MKDPYRAKKKDLVPHKYLEALGMRRRDCGVNFCREEKHHRKEQEIYGFDRRETFELGYSIFPQWLYEHLRMYLDAADPVIDLDAAETEADGKPMSLREAIWKVLIPLRTYLQEKNDDDRDPELLKRAAMIWAQIAWDVGW